FRQPGYSDFDIGLQKSVQISERFRFQLRGDAFNVFNAHHFNNVGTFIQSGGSGGSAFNNDVASPEFGKWNGGVSSPRNIQVSGRISFYHLLLLLFGPQCSVQLREQAGNRTASAEIPVETTHQQTRRRTDYDRLDQAVDSMP